MIISPVAINVMKLKNGRFETPATTPALSGTGKDSLLGYAGIGEDALLMISPCKCCGSAAASAV